MNQCYFCTNNVNSIDYKETETLKKFLGVQEKMESKRATGVCAKHQRGLAEAVKRARFLALLPFVGR